MMMGLMGPDKKDGIAASIVSAYSNGKKEHSSEPKQYSESCVMAAHELIDAVESKDPNRVISAFLALSIEIEPYESGE